MSRNNKDEENYCKFSAIIYQLPEINCLSEFWNIIKQIFYYLTKLIKNSILES